MKEQGMHAPNATSVKLFVQYTHSYNDVLSFLLQKWLFGMSWLTPVKGFLNNEAVLQIRFTSNSL